MADRWRLIQGRDNLQILTIADGPPVDPDAPVEVMPVAEHEAERLSWSDEKRRLLNDLEAIEAALARFMLTHTDQA